jgi:hypothetical protein
MDCRVKPGNDGPVSACRANQFRSIFLRSSFPCALEATKTGAPKNDFREPHQADLACPAPAGKIFLFRFFGKWCHPPAVPRGASRSSRTLSAGCDGRHGCARRAQARRTAKSCGPDPPTLGSSSVRRFHGATVANKPGTPGRSRISRNTIVQGMPDCSACPQFLTRVLSTLAHEAAGAQTPGIPCALLFEGPIFRHHLDALASREMNPCATFGR